MSTRKSSNSPHRPTFATPRSIRAALYLRVSTDKQASEGLSLSAQEAELTNYCHSRGWTIEGIYSDGGFSGKNTDRPMFNVLMARIGEGRVDAIVCTKLDRLTRSIRDLCELNEDVLRQYNCNLVCTRDGINTCEVGGTLILHLLAILAQIERENISNRVAAAISHIHNNGGHYGKVPFGKTTAPHPTQPNMKILVRCPIEGPWLDKVKEWYSEGLQATAIANKLNENGVKPRYADKWSMSMTHSLLRVNGILIKADHDATFRYDRKEAYNTALEARQAGSTLKAIASLLTEKNLRPKNAGRYTVSSVQDLLRGSIVYNTSTAQGLALHLKELGHSLRQICDDLLKAGHTAPRGGRWYPKTVADLMKRETTEGVHLGSKRAA